MANGSAVGNEETGEEKLQLSALDCFYFTTTHLSFGGISHLDSRIIRREVNPTCTKITKRMLNTILKTLAKIATNIKQPTSRLRQKQMEKGGNNAVTRSKLLTDKRGDRLHR